MEATPLYNNDTNRAMIINGFCSTRLIEVIRRIGEQNNIVPGYWLGRAEFEPRIAAMFPAVMFESSSDAMSGVLADFVSLQERAVLDVATIKKFAKYESNALMIMGRFKAFDHRVTYQEKLEIYYEYLAYFLGVVRKVNPVCFISRDTPHSLASYLLYAACVEENVPTIFFEATVLFNRFQATTQLGGETSSIAEQYRAELDATGPIRLSEASEKYHNIINDSYESYKDGAIPLKLGLHFDTTMPSVKSLLTMPKKDHPVWYRFRRKNKGLKFLRTAFSNLMYMQFVRRLRNYYDSQTVSTVNYDVPYVYAALHYQPEASTSPNGDVYVNQWLMVKVIAAALPEGWRVYVKEHPLIFSSLERGIRNFRSEVTYDALAAIPNVDLIPMSASTFKLIDNARAVATVGGTTGWEAVNRGKPALTFGHASYRGCEGVFHVPDLARCAAALEAIRAGYQVDRERVKAYLKALEDYSVPGLVEDVMDEERMTIAGIQPEDPAAARHNIDQVVDLLGSYVGQFARAEGRVTDPVAQLQQWSAAQVTSAS